VRIIIAHPAHSAHPFIIFSPLQIEKAAIDNRRQAKANNQIFVAPEEKLVLVIRIRGILNMAPKCKKILQLLRLRQINNAVFVRVNASTVNMLRMVEPYVAYGYPNLKSIRDLLYKRGFVKLSGQRIPISSNAVVKAGLGDKGYDCIEDIVHELYTVGPEFKAVANFLWPLKLSSPKGGVIGKKLWHFNEGGACGQQGDKINRVVKQMI
jgi:large subunit ribosomal protein L7e